MAEHRNNWAENYTYRAARWHHPETVEQIQDIVANSSNVKALGSRHSFNDIADTPDDLIVTEKLNRVLSLDTENNTVTVEGGIKYGHLGVYLYEQGYALHNMASLPHISVVGACATATHGSGVDNGNLATGVRALEFIAANGELVSLSRDEQPEEFAGAVVNLGGLGIVTKCTLDIMPTFLVRQDVYERLPISELEAHFDEIQSHAYSVSLFTDWQGDTVSQIWLKHKAADAEPVELAPGFFGATLAPTERHPITELSSDPCTRQMGVAGPWHERLPHFRMEFTPSNGEEIQSEFFVPLDQAVPALRAVAGLRDRITPLLHISEIRTIAADGLWMSPCYERAGLGIHFTWKKMEAEVLALLPVVEEQLAPFNPRPHWGKVFTMSPERIQASYQRLPEFRNLLQKYDPNGKFHNRYLDTYIFGA